jgi:hypothetical protein
VDCARREQSRGGCARVHSLFAWLISHQPTVLFSQNKPATSNQSAVLFSQNKSAPAISHQPNEQAVSCVRRYGPATKLVIMWPPIVYMFVDGVFWYNKHFHYTLVWI